MASSKTLITESPHTAIHDPVPSSCESEAACPEEDRCCAHEIERDVQRALLNLPDVHFSSLQVRRMPDGVCLTGVVEMPAGSDPQLNSLASQVAGVTRVLNHLVVKKTADQVRQDDHA